MSIPCIFEPYCSRIGSAFRGSLFAGTIQTPIQPRLPHLASQSGSDIQRHCKSPDKEGILTEHRSTISILHKTCLDTQQIINYTRIPPSNDHKPSNLRYIFENLCITILKHNKIGRRNPPALFFMGLNPPDGYQPLRAIQVCPPGLFDAEMFWCPFCWMAAFKSNLVAY